MTGTSVSTPTVVANAAGNDGPNNVIPPTKEITTNKITDNIKVSQSTLTLLTPSKDLTINTNATRMIKSFVAI